MRVENKRDYQIMPPRPHPLENPRDPHQIGHALSLYYTRWLLIDKRYLEDQGIGIQQLKEGFRLPSGNYIGRNEYGNYMIAFEKLDHSPN